MTRFVKTEVQMPKWRWRVACTILVMLGVGLAEWSYRAVQGPLEAKAAIRQLQDDPQGYAIARTWAASNVPRAVRTVGLVLVCCMWVPFCIKAVRYDAAQEQS